MIKTRSDALLVWVVNTAAGGGGSAVVVTNTPLLTTIYNSGGLYAMQSGNWTVGLSSTNNLVTLSPISTSGVLSGTSQSIELVNLSGYGVVGIQVNGTFNATLSFQGSVDGTNYFLLNCPNITTGLSTQQTTSAAQWQADVSGLSKFRVNCTSYTSGSANVALIGINGTTVSPINLYNIQGYLQTLASWDFFSGAYVNPIRLQQGVEGNTGGTTAKIQRVALVTDQGLPSGTNVIGNVNIVNSAGWVFNQSNTGGKVIINNSALFSMQSGAWTISSTILNTAGWVVAQSNTAGMTVNVINSANWVFAQSNTAGTKVQTYDTSVVYDGTTATQVKYATVTISASGNTAIVLPVSGKRIRVLSAFLMANNTATIIWQSDSSSATNLTGNAWLATNVGYVLPFHPNGWFQTATNTLLNLSSSTVGPIGGCITYIQTS